MPKILSAPVKRLHELHVNLLTVNRGDYRFVLVQVRHSSLWVLGNVHAHGDMESVVEGSTPFNDPGQIVCQQAF